jgi:hypothetical protein
MCVDYEVTINRRSINDELYDRVAKGDEDAIKAMVLNNLPYVRWKVRRYLNAHPGYEYLHDDLIGAGNCALVEIVAAMEGNTVESPNPTGFIYKGVANALRALVNTMVSERVAARHLGYPEKPPKVHSLVEEKYTAAVENDSIRCFDLMDSILSCCTTPDEVQLVRWRAEGYSNRAAASLTGIPARTVDRMLETIYARFTQKEANDL